MRDYKKENARRNDLNKRYEFKLNKEKASKFDEKLKEKNITAKSVFENAVNKFIEQT